MAVWQPLPEECLGTYSVLVIQHLLWPLTRLGEPLTNINEQWLLLTSHESAGYSIAIHTRYSFACPVQGELELRDVTLPAMGVPVIQNLHIPAGKTIAIVGSTGSGKSTLVKLLLRLYEVQAGTITLDGIELRDLKLKDLLLHWLGQSGCIFYFMALWRRILPTGVFSCSSEVITAAKIAEAHDFVMQLPKL